MRPNNCSYFPASPVQCNPSAAGTSLGSAEAFVELQKALNTLGDYRLSSNVNTLKWGLPFLALSAAVTPSVAHTLNNSYGISETDYCMNLKSYTTTGAPDVGDGTNSLAGNLGSAAFAAAVSLETSNGLEISGLNAEEQSDISFIATYQGPQNAAFVLETFVYYDAMILLRENNGIELIM